MLCGARKALLSGCHLIIVDNPANYLSQYELFEFQQMLKKIRKEGISVLYVGNHHQELFKIADRTALFRTVTSTRSLSGMR